MSTTDGPQWSKCSEHCGLKCTNDGPSGLEGLSQKCTPNYLQWSKLVEPWDLKCTNDGHSDLLGLSPGLPCVNDSPSGM